MNKEAKEHRERNKTQNPLTSELSFSRNNPYVKNNSQDKEQAEDSIDTKSMTSECILDNKKMALEDEVTESTINEKPVNTVYITDSKSTDSMETEVADSMVTLDKISNNLEETSFTTALKRAAY
ncbi:7072_t:CDS:2 [Cetraspora pellucida]|uniref:7072_t:CDS:1 n=1 Tax=Cetraspora pellucida TaxID=1433469 RepID=A0ACA9K6R7_9GLOM|nr:7072_t:CDS:2 [Cetraspora pellucida]